MKKKTVVSAAAATVFGLAAVAGDAAVIETKWVEKVGFANGSALRIQVRKMQFTKTNYTVWVGMKNLSKRTFKIRVTQYRQSRTLPVTFWAGPGIYWHTYESGGSWWPGSGIALTHNAAATQVRPRYPTQLAAGKSWYGVFSGSVAKLPKNRLLRVGFGLFRTQGDPTADVQVGGRLDETIVSTDHTFKLPRRR